MKEKIIIKTPKREWTIPVGKPVRIQWKAKNKDRTGLCVGLGWIKRGEKPHTILLVHQTFSTWDAVETEYPSKWTIWESQILDIQVLGRTVL